MRAFIAGSTGYTGRALVAHLRQLGHHVCAHIRPDSPSLHAMSERFSSLGAELSTSPWLDAPLGQALRDAQPDTVFCLIGTTRAQMKRLKAQGRDPKDASYQAVDLGLTQLLLHACARQDSPPPTFVYLSAMGTSPRALNAYARARYQAEQAVIASHLPYLIARPAFISGDDRPESRPMERLGASLSDASLKLLGVFGADRAVRQYRSTSADELARALARHALRPQRDLILEAHDLKDDSP